MLKGAIGYCEVTSFKSTSIKEVAKSHIIKIFELLSFDFASKYPLISIKHTAKGAEDAGVTSK